MAKNTVTSKDTIKQGNDIAMGAHTRLKRPERPPIYLICEGEVVENPDPSHIATEIDYTVMSPVRVVYELIDKYNEDDWVSPRGMQAVANTLFMALEKWEYFSRYLTKGVQHVDQ